MSEIRQMALTPELVTRTHRVVEDTGPEQGVAYHSDEDYDAWVRTILAQRNPGTPVWLFTLWLAHLEARVRKILIFAEKSRKDASTHRSCEPRCPGADIPQNVNSRVEEWR